MMSNYVSFDLEIKNNTLIFKGMTGSVIKETNWSTIIYDTTEKNTILGLPELGGLFGEYKQGNISLATYNKSVKTLNVTTKEININGKANN